MIGRARKWGRGWSRRAGSVLLAFLFLFTSSCAGLFEGARPGTAKGSLQYPRTPLSNAAVAKYVNSLGQKLFQHADIAKTGVSNVNVTVLETSRIQGASYFYSPSIEVTRGMLNALRNEAELAALIGHEIGHKVLHRAHAFTARGASTRDVEYADWSQAREREADEYGAALAGKVGYDPYALFYLFDRLSRFQKGGVLAWLGETTATHKDFRNRAKELKKYLERNGIIRGGVLKAEEYKLALAPLRNIHTQDIVNEMIAGGPAAALKRLSDIEDEVKGFERSKEAMPFARFIEIMDELSGTMARFGIDPEGLLESRISKAIPKQFKELLFMKEVMSQDTPLWADEELGAKIADILASLGRIGVGFIPVVGDAVDLYEFLSGKEFGTGRALVFSERVLTAGALLAGSGKMWRETAHVMEETLADARYAKKFGRRTVAEAGDALGDAKKIGGSVSRWQYHTPINPGPLDQKVVQTFRSGTYMQETLAEPVVLYRVYSDPEKKFRQYWTRIEPSGPLQATINSALDPSFGNQATQLVKVRVPAGQTIFEGVVAPQGGLVGGGNQIWIHRVSPEWEIP